jgi:uncharacterized protein (DUF362 family)
MNRRQFLKRLTAASAATAAALLAPGGMKLFADDAPRSGSATVPYPDLVAVKGGEPGAMFDRGIAAIGGMARFVSPGDTVAVKPNMSWNVDPERGATTHPALVARIVEHCFEAGAKRVYVFDNALDSWRLAYATSGIEAASKSAGATVVPASSNGYYQEVDIPGARILTSAKVHELVIESDVFINVPVLKHHGSARITAAMKNLMGVVWNRNFYHSRGLNQCIADFPLYRAPDLNVVDAYRVMMAGGPRGSSYALQTELMKMQIIGTDIVAVDTAAAKTWGIDPSRVGYIPLGAELGLGTTDLDSLAVERILL